MLCKPQEEGTLWIVPRIAECAQPHFHHPQASLTDSPEESPASLTPWGTLLQPAHSCVLWGPSLQTAREKSLRARQVTASRGRLRWRLQPE